MCSAYDDPDRSTVRLVNVIYCQSLFVRDAAHCENNNLFRSISETVAQKRIARLFQLAFDHLLDQVFDQWHMLCVNVVHSFEALQQTFPDGHRILIQKQICLPKSRSTVRHNITQELSFP